MSQLRPQTQLAGIDSLLKEECVLFGTGDISRSSLEALQTVFAIEAVITKSDRMRNGAPRPTAVSEWAQQHSAPLHYADSADDLQNLLQQNHLRSQVAVVVDYGVLIPQSVIDYFPLGIINSHFSLLPRHRGPNPIRAALLAGDKQAGVTIMQITAALDEGPILTQETVAISNEDTTPSLTKKLIEVNRSLLPSTLLRYIRGEITPSPQDENEATWSRKTKKEDGLIDWSKPAEQIEREVRAYADWPKSRTTLEGIDVIVTEASSVVPPTSNLKPGEVHIDKENNAITVQTTDKALRIQRLKPAGKKELTTAEFIRGYVKST